MSPSRKKLIYSQLKIKFTGRTMLTYLSFCTLLNECIVQIHIISVLMFIYAFGAVIKSLKATNCEL